MVAVAGVIMNFVKTSQCELQKAFKSFSFVNMIKKIKNCSIKSRRL